MNLQQLRQVLEVQRAGSISRAAEKLYMNQPNLSKAIMALEGEFGISIFQRSASGVIATREGQEFLRRAADLVAKADAFENAYKREEQKNLEFRISLPRGSYLTHAFVGTVREKMDGKTVNISYKETNNQETIDNVVSLGYDMGIIRFPMEFESDYKRVLVSKQLQFQEVLTFRFFVLMSREHPLASARQLRLSELQTYTALIHGDNYASFIPDRETEKAYHLSTFPNTITLFERGSQFDFLRSVPGTFMLTSPLPGELLQKHGLVQIRLAEEDSVLFEDLLISRRGHHYTDFEQAFLHRLLDTERELQELE